MRRVACLCLVVVAAVTTVDAQAPQILNARHLDATRVEMSIEDFAWREAAPAALRQLEGTVPTAARRKELEQLAGDYGALVGFDLPVPASQSRPYLLIHSGGVTPLVPQGLHGTASFDLPPAGQPITGVAFYGELRATAANNHAIGGGFVFVHDRPRTAAVTPSTHTADELMGPGGTDYFARGTPFWNIVTQFAFTIEGDATRYVFVQWAEDKAMKEAGCTQRYSLFRLDPAPVEIASNNYGCDV